MRDVILVLIFVASIPYMIKRPSLGIVMWIWLSVMNPHRLTYGFAFELPIAAAAAICTFIGLLVTKEERRMPLTPPVVLLFLFVLWMCLTSLFPFHPNAGYDMWSKVMKIMLMLFVAFYVIHSKEQIHWVLWITTFSIAFYGVKGGLFTLATGGSYLVWGPGGSFIQGNNEVALAFVITIPLLRYIQFGMKKPWQRWAMTGSMLLCAMAALGSHSRGALLAIAAMGAFLWVKSRNKMVMGILLVILAAGGLAFMPAEWTTRMQTIETYDVDQSALGRINAWYMAFNLAKANPLGGGFDIYTPDTFARYAPNPLDIHAAHSIYFQILGEHGFVGLFLFLSVGAATWFSASDAKRKAKDRPGLEWVPPLMDMIKVSMVGYAVGGAFLSLAYFDLPYYLIVIVVATRSLVQSACKSDQIPKKRVAEPWRRDHFGVVPAIDGVVAPVNDESWRGHRGFDRLPGGT